MKIGWLIYKKEDASKNQSYITWFIEEAKQQNILLKLILREELLIGIDGRNYFTYYENKHIDLHKFCIIRKIESTLQAHFTAQNIPCFNNYQTSIICNDKSATHIEVAKLGIPAVKTFHYESYQKTPPLPYPFILKTINGRRGSEDILIENNAEYLNSQIKLNNINMVIITLKYKMNMVLIFFLHTI